VVAGTSFVDFVQLLAAQPSSPAKARGTISVTQKPK